MSALPTWIQVVLFVVTLATPLQAQLTDEQVRESMQAGVRFLLSKQEPNGSWPDYDYSGYPTGVTSLCTLALLNAGMTVEDAEIAQALNYLRGQRRLGRTYTVALQTIVFCAAGQKQDLRQIQVNVGWLQSAQRTGAAGDGAGSWGYGRDDTNQEDPSNAQFAMLALYEAERAGIAVKDSTWRLALDYWRRTQRADGSFAYDPKLASTGSMTCAGIGSMIIAAGQIHKLDASIEGDDVVCCGAEEPSEDSVERALKWLADHFSVSRNPSAAAIEGFPGMYHYYYLYGLERVGRLAGRRFIGNHDWYREGAEELIKRQDPLSGYWTDGTDQLTCSSFAVLFLSKGRRPVLLSKLKRLPEEDWNHHRHDVSHLTTYVEKKWQRDLTWQVVDISAATAEDLWQSPVLFLTGRDALELTVEQKEALKTYIDMGGFLFAENCCEGGDFDRDFRLLMEELFPKSPLRLLPKDHAVWYAEERVDPKFLRALEGIDVCCRTGVVYCPEKLSCYWELAQPRRDAGDAISPRIQREINACLAIGTNVLAYATGRELKQKLDQPALVSVVKSTSQLDRATLHVAKLEHAGGSDDAPSALSNVLAVIEQQTRLPVSSEKHMMSPSDPNLPDYPIAFMHGRRNFQWSQADRKALRRFIENGGFLFADAICANQEFADALRREMRAVFPEHQISPIPPQHPIFSTEYHGHDVRNVALRDPRRRGDDRQPLSVRVEQVAPLLEGIEIEGRYVVMFSPYDLSCALENRPSLECRGYTREDAAKLVTNIVLYAMQR